MNMATEGIARKDRYGSNSAVRPYSVNVRITRDNGHRADTPEGRFSAKGTHSRATYWRLI